MTERRRVLVTGAGAPGGIGMATARRLGQAGADLAIVATTGRIHARAAELLAEGIAVTAHIADLTEADQVQRLLDAVGPVDVLVNLSDQALCGVGVVPRIIEVVGSEPGGREKGRERWRLYRQAGVEPAAHDLSGSVA